MATQTIDATLFASSHPDIVKRTSVSGLIFSAYSGAYPFTFRQLIKA